MKLLYQPSEGDTRPAYIMGHSVQVISVLVAAAGSFFAVPLAVRIHDGVKLTNRDQKTLPEKCCDLLMALNLRQPGYLVADAYYARAGMAQRTIADGLPQCLVDSVEVVDIDTQHADTVLLTEHVDPALTFFQKERSIRQSGKRILP